MEPKQSGKSRGLRVAALTIVIGMALIIGVLTLMFVAITWSSEGKPARPTVTVTTTTTVIDFSKADNVDYLKRMSTALTLDLAPEYSELLGRHLNFLMTTEETVQKTGLHAVAPFGKHCVLGIGNNPDQTINVVVASRYNDGLTAELDDVPLYGHFGNAITGDINSWLNDCNRGTYQFNGQADWVYAHVSTKA